MPIRNLKQLHLAWLKNITKYKQEELWQRQNHIRYSPIIKRRIDVYKRQETERIQNDDNAIILDTRTVYEFERGHIENSVNIPVDEIRNRINEIPKDKKIYAICQSGLRSYIASRILMGYGLSLIHIFF